MKDPSLYVPVHLAIWDHPKTRRLARALGVHEVQAVGHLVALWTWAVQYAPDGDLSEFAIDEIAAAGRWPDDEEAFVAALRGAGWLDDHIINDWANYAGAGLAERSAARDRKRRERDRKRGHGIGHASVTDGARDMSRNVTPERDRNGSGSERNGTERGAEVVVAPAAAPAPPKEPIDRSRQNPNAPPPRDGVVVASTPRRLNGAGVGFMENPADFPETPEELVEMHRADLAKSFPMFDGSPPRPTLIEAVSGKWGNYVAKRARMGEGHKNAYAALKTWLGELAQKHRVSWERERATVIDGSAAIARTKRDLLKPIEGPHPSEADGAPTPEDVAKLIAGIGKKPAPKTGRVLPSERRARAGPAGGDRGSGATAAEPAE